MTQNKWPNDYPAHLTIPPTNAEPIDEKLYRFVRNSHPIADDFLPSYKDPVQKELINRHPSLKDKPEFYGTSFFNTETAIKSKKEQNPERFRNEEIAVGQVVKNHGLASKKNAHVTVWFYEGKYPNGFKLI